jgi:hypothetical protein
MDWNYGSLTYKEESLMLNTTILRIFIFISPLKQKAKISLPATADHF